jgi:predicted DsbA family dithiol-disulfide isomerase
MSEIRLQVAFDYVDPGSYLVYEVLSRWIRDRGEAVMVSWIPLELRPPPAAGIDPQDSEWVAMTAAMENEALAAGIPFRRPERVPRTRKAHELSLHAREKGLFEEAHRAIFDAHFVSGEDIGRVDVLTSLAEKVGLEGAEARTVLGVDRFLAEVEQARGLARGMGVRGVPTIELPGLRIEGFEGENALRDVLDRIVGIQD